MNKSTTRRSRIFKRINPMLMLGVFFMSMIASLITLPETATAAFADDFAMYNRLVGFKYNCGLDGGGDSKVTKEDVNNVYDKDNGDNGNAAAISGGREDVGTAVVIGYSIQPSAAGVVTCNAVVTSVVKGVNTAKSTGWYSPTTSDEAKSMVVNVLSGKTDSLKTGSDETKNIFTLYEKVELRSNAWSSFVTTYLDPSIAFYKNKIGSVSKVTQAKLLLPALNYCFDWVDSSANAKISIDSQKLYGQIPASGYSVDRVRKFVPEAFQSGDGGKFTLGEENAQIGSIKLSFKDAPEYKGTERWFPLGYAQTLFMSGVANGNTKLDGRAQGGLISCPELASNANNFKSQLRKDTDNKVKVAENDSNDGIDNDGGTDAATDDTASGPDASSCEVQVDTPLSWVICPVMNGLNKVLHWFRRSLQDALDFRVNEKPDVKNNLQTAWGNFRNIANILFVISLLFIIISQTLSGRF